MKTLFLGLVGVVSLVGMSWATSPPENITVGNWGAFDGNWQYLSPDVLSGTPFRVEGWEEEYMAERGFPSGSVRHYYSLSPEYFSLWSSGRGSESDFVDTNGRGQPFWG
jgi:hypothetical protein